MAEGVWMKPTTICGAAAVAALFARRPEDVQRLFYLPMHRMEVGEWCAVLAAAKKPYRMVEDGELASVAGTTYHGGIVAVARVRVPAIFDAAKPPRGKLLLVLDGIMAPQVLGSIARAASFYNVPNMLIGEGLGHAMPGDAAYRMAEGGLDYLNLYRTRDLPKAIAALEPHYRTVAFTASREASPLDELPRDRPIALVLGNEEKGVSDAVRDGCRRQVRLSGGGRVRSLNVTQAAAVLLHSLMGG